MPRTPTPAGPSGADGSVRARPGGARRRREPADRRRELLDAAARHADEHGLDALTPAAVAARSGASKALVFHYFASTAGLRRAVALEAVAELEAATVAPDDRPLVERPALAVASYLDAVEARRLVWQDLWRGVLAEDDATQEALARVRDSLVARLTSTVSATTTDALPTTPRLRLLAAGWVALVENVTAAWLGGGDLSRADIESLVLASAVVLVPELPEPARSAVLAIARANSPAAG
ncbi:TetR/AcrR family transcriptional regulator [Cellulosimicrobium cellulans]|uniref:TetR/AcrR family transcriptional regulator n=1 Tax=Cellulosimicrobium cellulans TaxID=1710 RepID=UPI001BA79A01|nr:TetR/AcrR family transcriptional regulator [Cellulosimicrobium cellulans]QUB99748.1 helix-turn-helix transcriptional regulator [Cellulosimicrobium cellulans]